VKNLDGPEAFAKRHLGKSFTGSKALIQSTWTNTCTIPEHWQTTLGKKMHCSTNIETTLDIEA
jgi:hypothetical protein